MCQRFIDVDASSRQCFIKDEKTKKWVIRDGCDPRAVIKHLRSEELIGPTPDHPPFRNRAMAASIETTLCGPENYPTENIIERAFVARPLPPTVQVLNQYGTQPSATPASSGTRCEEVGCETPTEAATPRNDIKAAAALTVAEDEKHNQILELISNNQAKSDAAAAAANAATAAANAKLLQEMADSKAKVAATEEALSTIIMANRKSSKMNL